jgi:hypothetical protein
VAFEAFFNHRHERARPNLWRHVTVVLSLGLHGALLVGAVTYAAWRVDEVPPPSVFVTFAGGRALPPPPRPASPPAETARAKTRAEKAEPLRLAVAVQPQLHRWAEDRPAPEAEHTEPDREVAGGEPGAAEALPPPLPEAQPVTVPLAVGSSQRITDIADPRFRPSLPGPLNRPGVMLWGLFRICVGVDGGVTGVRVLKTAAPEADADWTRVIRTWRYRPYAIDGRPTPFCHTIRLEVRGAP